MLLSLKCIQYSMIGILFFSLLSCGSGTTTQSLNASDAITQLKEAEKQGLLPILNRDKSIAGQDTNHNGVRDDIDAYIESLPDTYEQKLALRQDARAINAAMTVDVMDKKELEMASLKITRAVECLYSRYTENGAANKKGKEIEAFMVNTQERFLAYHRFSIALSGSVISSLPFGEDGCDAE